MPKSFPVASVRHVQEMNRRATEEFGIPSLLLMEQGGRALAEAVKEMGRGPVNRTASERAKALQRQETRVSATVVCGGWKIGGEGFVAARLLESAGIPCIVAITDPKAVGGDAAVQLDILRKMKLNLVEASSPEDLKIPLKSCSVIVDALLGTELTQVVSSPDRDVIEMMNSSRRTLVAADVPSGLDAETGKVLGTGDLTAAEASSSSRPGFSITRRSSSPRSSTNWATPSGCLMSTSTDILSTRGRRSCLTTRSIGAGGSSRAKLRDGSFRKTAGVWRSISGSFPA